MILSQANWKRLFFLSTFVALSSTQSLAQTNPQPNLSIYEDENIKATGISASYDKYKFAQASIRIENKTGKDLLFAVVPRGVSAISDLGQSSECAVNGLKTFNGSLSGTPNPLDFSRLKPKAKVTIGISYCQIQLII